MKEENKNNGIMSEENKNNAINNENFDPGKSLENDPEYKRFKQTKAAERLIQNYENDDVRKAVLDAGLKEELLNDPSIIENEKAFGILFKQYQRKAMEESSKASDTTGASTGETKANQTDKSKRNQQTLSQDSIPSDNGEKETVSLAELQKMDIDHLCKKLGITTAEAATIKAAY